MGNALIQDSATGQMMELREGFVPVGMKEHGGILYIVSADKAKHLAHNLIPALRQVLLSGLKSVYVVSLIVIILSLVLNQLYKQKKIVE